MQSCKHICNTNGIGSGSGDFRLEFLLGVALRAFLPRVAPGILLGMAPAIFAWSDSKDFCLERLRGFLLGVAPGMFAWRGSGEFCWDGLRGFLPGVHPGILAGSG